MHPLRTSFAPFPRYFGRGPARVHAIALPAPTRELSEELKLFATTYAAAFLFVSCLIA